MSDDHTPRLVHRRPMPEVLRERRAPSCLSGELFQAPRLRPLQPALDAGSALAGPGWALRAPGAAERPVEEAR